MEQEKEFKGMIGGNRHFSEEHRLFGTLLKITVFASLASIVAYLLLYWARVGFGIIFLAFLILFSVYYATKLNQVWEFPMQVSEEMVATPTRNKIVMQGRRTGIEKEWDFRISKINPFTVNLKAYIHGKSNRNVLITGSSGQGKSKLTRHLLSIMEYQKVIFSFKANEEYLKTDYNCIGMIDRLPNPFTDKEAFISAFAVAFPINSVGIQASMIPTTLEDMIKKSRDWTEFNKILENAIKSSKDMNRKAALLFIQANVRRLKYDTGEFEVAKDTVVLDFSALNEDARSFYAELVLRQVYHEMEKQHRKDVLICVDEAHRMTKGGFGNYHTIIVEMSREIRDKGMLWITTQNYTDIPDNIRNQFASQFMFKTTSQDDLGALKSIEPLLSWTVSSLPNHYFVDAQFPNIHTFVPVYYYNPKGEVDAKPEEKAIAKFIPIPQRSVATAAKSTDDRPSATQHAGILAIYNNPETELNVLAKYLKVKGWITGDPTIYGAMGRPGVFDSLVGLGLAKEEGNLFRLTEQALGWVDPRKMLEGVEDGGSDLHLRLMKAAIIRLHEENMLVIVSKDRDSPDLVGYPMGSGKKKYLWDDAKRRAYEVQTTARKENVLANRERDIGLGLAITWVTYDRAVMEEIRRLTNNEDEYLIVKA